MAMRLGLGVFFLFVLGFILASLANFLTLWLPLWLGIVIALVIVVPSLFFLFMYSGALVDGAVSCLIIIVLCALLWPVTHKLKITKARRLHTQAAFLYRAEITGTLPPKL